MIDPDDPQLTTYAAGELSAEDQAIIESALRESPAARGEVEAIRRTLRLLEQALAAEELPRLTDMQRVGIEALITSAHVAAAPVSRGGRWRLWLWTSAGVAASVGVAIIGLRLVEQNAERRAGRMFAARTANTSEQAHLAPREFESAAADQPPSEAGSGQERGEVLAQVEPEHNWGGAPDLFDYDIYRSAGAQQTAPYHYFTGDLKVYVGQNAALVSGSRENVAKVERLLGAEGAAGLSSDPASLSGEAYAAITENPFRDVSADALSTFAIDVDTASYSNSRRLLLNGQLPRKDAVRIEEFINYFPYEYEAPADGEPFAANIEIATCPWTPEHRLARIGLKGRELDLNDRPPCSLTFLLDVSGSMAVQNRLPLMKEALRLLVGELQPHDRVAIVVYAGAAGVVLPSTPASMQRTILASLEKLEAGGGTAGSEGIQLAYDTAAANYMPGGSNRVVLATDGDFNIGITDQGELASLIANQAQRGIFLSVLGVGMGGVRDDTLERLADNGNGHYAYIDDLLEARKVLVSELGGTLFTVAKDVKIQVEFNPQRIAAYRLIGYENRLLSAEDFDDDAKDAGEIGAGHTVTAIYELVPAGEPIPVIAWITNAPTADGRARLTPNADRSGAAPNADDASVSPSSGASGVLDPVAAAPAAGDYPRPLLTWAGSGGGGSPFVAPGEPAQAFCPDEVLALRLRYKEPEGDQSAKLTFVARDGGASFEEASADFRFQACVAAFGMQLRESPYRGTWNLANVEQTARGALGQDAQAYRAEFTELVKQAAALRNQ